MRFKSILCATLLILVVFVVSSCGSGGGGGTEGANLVPNFDFSKIGTSASSMQTASLVLPTGNKEALATYYLIAPFLVGFTKSSEKLYDGQELSFPFDANTHLDLKVSISGNIITLAGLFSDGSGSMQIVLNTATYQFSYQQYIDVEDSMSTEFITYLKLVNVQLDSNGFYHTTGQFYCVQSGSQDNSFRGEMDYFSGTVPQGKGNDISKVGDVIIGCYGMQHKLMSSNPPVVGTSLSVFENYIGNASWNSTGEAPIILYYDKQKGSFISNANKNGALQLGSSYTTPPWSL